MNTRFKPFSKYPPVYKDIAFWITDAFTENNLAEICRSAGVQACMYVCQLYMWHGRHQQMVWHAAFHSGIARRCMHMSSA